MLDQISQFAIPILGISAIVLVSRKNKWAFILGTVSMPFWFLTSIINHQWGVFIANIGYAISWVYGFYWWFFKS